MEGELRAPSAPSQGGVDKVVMALLKQKATPGIRVKPIEPVLEYLRSRCEGAPIRDDGRHRGGNRSLPGSGGANREHPGAELSHGR